MTGPGLCVLFAGGGTGGHLYPGLAIAEQLAEASARSGTSARAFFACSTRPLDAQILAHEHVDFRAIPAEPFALAPRSFLRFVRTWGGAVRAARALIRELRGTHGRVHLVAMGGFVAAPVVQAARVERCPIALVNLDATPGKANRWIARHSGQVLSAAELADHTLGKGWIGIAPIVRRSALPPGDPPLCRRSLGLDPDRPTILVTGASQGAKSINDFVTALARESSAVFRAAGWQVLHQAGGRADLAQIEHAYADAGVPALVRPFLSPMGPAWGAADLAVSRSGAGSVAEVWAAAVPTLFLPYPYHRDQHQRLNALPLERRGACAIAADQIDTARNLRTAGPIMLDLMQNADHRAQMRSALQALGPANGAASVAQAILSQS